MCVHYVARSSLLYLTSKLISQLTKERGLMCAISVGGDLSSLRIWKTISVGNMQSKLNTNALTVAKRFATVSTCEFIVKFTQGRNTFYVRIVGNAFCSPSLCGIMSKPTSMPRRTTCVKFVAKALSAALT